MESSDIQAVNEQIATLIKDILIRETACAYDEDKNFFSCEIYADYRDCAENDTVISVVRPMADLAVRHMHLVSTKHYSEIMVCRTSGFTIYVTPMLQCCSVRN